MQVMLVRTVMLCSKDRNASKYSNASKDSNASKESNASKDSNASISLLALLVHTRIANLTSRSMLTKLVHIYLLTVFIYCDSYMKE